MFNLGRLASIEEKPTGDAEQIYIYIGCTPGKEEPTIQNVSMELPPSYCFSLFCPGGVDTEEEKTSALHSGVCRGMRKSAHNTSNWWMIWGFLFLNCHSLSLRPPGTERLQVISLVSPSWLIHLVSDCGLCKLESPGPAPALKYQQPNYSDKSMLLCAAEAAAGLAITHFFASSPGIFNILSIIKAEAPDSILHSRPYTLSVALTLKEIIKTYSVIVWLGLLWIIEF